MALTIGDLGKATNTKVETIRYYERIGLLAKPDRTGGNYRAYGQDALARLSFIRRARDLGFSIPQIGALVALWQDRQRPSRQVKALAQAHIGALEQKARELLTMKAALEHLVHCCQGDDRPDCPILQTLEAADLGALAGATAGGGRGRLRRPSAH